MLRKLISPIVMTALALCLPLGASAGPPFLTDDPEPIDFGHFELYTFTTSDTSGGARSVMGPALEFNAGVLPNVHFHLVFPYARLTAPGSMRALGYGDTEVGVKFRFVQETKNRPQIGIFPMAEVATGDAAKGLGNGRTWYRLPLWIQKSWGPWKSYGGGGFAVNSAPGMRNYAFGGWLIQRDLSEKFTLGGEVFTQGPASLAGSGYTVVDLGGYYNPTKQLNVLFMIGHSVAGEQHAVSYLGLYYTFPRAEETNADTKIPTKQ